jgi:cell division protein FtsI (penicillin-binding protein 3)
VATRTAPPRRSRSRRPPRPPRPPRSRRRTPPPVQRIRWLLLLAGLCFVVLFGRVVHLQIVQGDDFAARAAGQHQSEIVTLAPRGAILDRDGYHLALSEQARTIGATLSEVEDRARVVSAVAEASGESPDTIMRRLDAEDVVHVDLARQVPPAQAKRVEEMEIPGLDFVAEERRVYPSGMAAPVIGVVDLEGQGLAGLELQYDEILRGQHGIDVRVRDPGGNTISTTRVQEMQRGRTITTGLDRDIQRAAEDIIAATMQRNRAKSVTAIVLEPTTGQVLAMASAPGPPQGDFRRGRPNQLRLRALTDVYEPGSTFKAVTVGAGLATGRLKPSTPVDVGLEWTLYDATLKDSEPNPGRKTTAEALGTSSNIGIAKLAYDHLSDERGRDAILADWIPKFGFGEPTGIDLPGEVGGIVTPFEKWSGTTPLNIPIGHGIATTPLQIAQVYATIANDGVARRPHLVTRIEGEPPVEIPSERVLPAKAARQLKRMLEGVVSDTGTGAAASIPGYSVAGKTGTTKKIDPDGTYSDSRYLAWFVGFAPVKNPRVVTLVMVDEPGRGGYYGGDVAGPAFGALTARALVDLGVPQDRPVAE